MYAHSKTVKHFVEHRVWLRRLHPLHFAIGQWGLAVDPMLEERVHDDEVSVHVCVGVVTCGADPKFLPKDLRVHQDTGDGPISVGAAPC